MQSKYPWRDSDGLGVVGELAITLNELIMPCTVPNSPIIGLNVPINAM